MLFCLAALIFRHPQKFSPRGFVFPDRLNTLNRRPGPKSLRLASQRSLFPVRPCSMPQEERSLELLISRLIPTLSSRKFVIPDRVDSLDQRPGPKSLHHLCKVGSIVYSISCTPEAADLNYGCAAMRSNLVKISSKKTFETLKISLSKTSIF